MCDIVFVIDWLRSSRVWLFECSCPSWLTGNSSLPRYCTRSNPCLWVTITTVKTRYADSLKRGNSIYLVVWQTALPSYKMHNNYFSSWTISLSCGPRYSGMWTLILIVSIEKKKKSFSRTADV